MMFVNMRTAEEHEVRQPPSTSTGNRIRGRGWGGWRPGAGRKRAPIGKRRVPHDYRDPIHREAVAHVTTHVRKGFPPLRSRESMKVLMQIFHEVSEQCGFRLVEYSVQYNHFHLVIEADGPEWLSRGLKS